MDSRRRKYTIAFKLRVIEAAENTNNSVSAREFSVNEKLVKDWRKRSHKLHHMPKRKCRGRTGIAKWPELEKKIADWVFENRKNGYCVTRDSIRRRALKEAKKDGILVLC